MIKNKKKIKKEQKRSFKAYCPECEKFVDRFWLESNKDLCNNWSLFQYDLSNLNIDILIILDKDKIKLELSPTYDDTCYLNLEFISEELTTFINHPLSSKFFPFLAPFSNKNCYCDKCQDSVIIGSRTKEEWKLVQEEWKKNW